MPIKHSSKAVIPLPGIRAISAVTLISGTSTNVPAGALFCIITLRGAGGSGAGGSAATNGGGGGGGGATVKGYRDLTGIATISYVLGTRGAAALNNTDGNDATDSTCTVGSSTVMTAGGGKKGVSVLGAPGVGGTASGDALDTLLDGLSGTNGVVGASAAGGNGGDTDIGVGGIGTTGTGPAGTFGAGSAGGGSPGTGNSSGNAGSPQLEIIYYGRQ